MIARIAKRTRGPTAQRPNLFDIKSIRPNLEELYFAYTQGSVEPNPTLLNPKQRSAS